MLFLQYFMKNLVLTKSSGPKRHSVAFTAPILLVSVCITQISVGGGGWDRPAQQSECPFTAKMRPFLLQLSTSQTSEYILP
jgi:hypothetical protein